MELESKHINYAKENKLYVSLIVIGCLSIIILFLVSLCIGNYHTTINDVFQALINPSEYPQIYNIIILSRLPRLIGAIFVGAALSVSGLVYQEIFANKMASPDLLGVSSGAGVGASISIYFGVPFIFVSLFSFIGGIIAVFLTILISNLFSSSRQKSITLILAGIIIGGLMNSLIGLFKYLANDTQLSTITFWLMGGFYNITYNQLLYSVPVIFLGLIALLLLRWKVVILKNGDDDAKIHGINAKVIRIIIIIITTIITSVAICISGTVSWVGLAIPNLIRIIVKNDGKKLMPLCLIYGSLIMQICDLLARTLTNTEIPVGIITGIIGTIIFIIILVIQKRKSYDRD